MAQDHAYPRGEVFQVSDEHDKSDFPTNDAGDEPEVFVGEPQPFLSDLHSEATPVAERAIPVAAVTGIVLVLALLMGGLSGYLLGSSGQDVSPSGQDSYACALIEKVREDHQRPEDWGDVFEDHAFSDVLAAAGLFGDFVIPGDEETTLQELAVQLRSAFNEIDVDAINSAVEALDEECRKSSP